MSDQAELKPCPFCGGDTLDICGTNFTPENRRAYAVTCRTVRCHGAVFSLGYGLFPTEAQATAAWNTRAPKGGE